MSIKIGDKVKWSSHAGHAEGKVVKVAREDGEVSGFHYKATPDDPRYIVELEGGKHAAHTEEALTKVH
jgi:Hypervirulence associated proteins TUDOR domain